MPIDLDILDNDIEPLSESEEDDTYIFKEIDLNDYKKEEPPSILPYKFMYNMAMVAVLIVTLSYIV